ncbi:MAG: Obg family GTPase CgtA [Candidatus Levybacteria bacterium]|nr:Obg family GTPase CgtA [Candidatus Levybacteria bacterium]
MLIDEVAITIKAGDGGKGAVSFRRNAQTAKGGPDGGNGGNGGSIYLQGSTNIADLSQFRYKKRIQGEDGVRGKKKNLFGKNGGNRIVFVPVGTRVIDLDDATTWEIENEKDLILVAKGGSGGRGNNEFKSATNQTPMEFEPGEKGEEKKVKLELRLIADVGFVGYPNAGKSSLLDAFTNAKPKIGNYPFTTLDPNLGMSDGVILADIPGIIEGASKGKGLGLKFLKHIEKTKFLVYCIEATQEDPLKTYHMIQQEFEAYDQTLLKKEHMIVLTKIDLMTKKEVEEKIKVFGDEKTIGVSIHEKDTLDAFKKLLLQTVNQ